MKITIKLFNNLIEYLEEKEVKFTSELKYCTNKPMVANIYCLGVSIYITDEKSYLQKFEFGNTPIKRIYGYENIIKFLNNEIIKKEK